MSRFRRRERDLQDELRSHLALDAAARRAAGASPDEAARAAARDLGNELQIREITRAMWSGQWLQTLGQDARYGLRQLRRNPAFAAAAVLTLALGIGAAAAIVSLAYTALWQPLPFRDAARLYVLHETTPRVAGTVSVSYPNFLDWQKQARAYSGMSFLSWDDLLLTGNSQPRFVKALAASPNFLALVGVKPLLGHGLAAPSNDSRAVVTYRFWQGQLQGDPHVVGRALDLNGLAITIAGVLPPSFQLPRRCDLLVPMAYWIAQDQSEATDRGDRGDSVVLARLAPGATAEQARSEMSTIAARLARQYPHQDNQFGVAEQTLRQAFVGNEQPALWVLLGGVTFLLLIACANVANLFLVRGAARAREMAVRRALGASRRRIVRQLLTEALVLAGLGGAAGAGLAVLGVHWLAALIPASLGVAGVALRGPALAASLAIVLLAAILFGLAPALQASRPEVQAELKEDDRAAATGRRSSSLRALVASAQMALAVMLVIGAGLMMQSLRHLLDADPGFQPQHLYALDVSLRPGMSEPAIFNYWRQALAKVQALPGIEAAGLGDNVPFSGDHSRTDITLAGMKPPAPGNFPHPDMHFVAPGYFATMGIPLLRGRGFNPADTKGAPQVAIISRMIAREYFPHGNAVGQQMCLCHPPGRKADWFTIIGVAGSTKMYGLAEPPRLEIYLSAWQFADGEMSFLVRSPLPPATLEPELRSAVAAVDANQPLGTVQSMADLVSHSVSTPQTTFWLLALFGGVALLLAAVGVYGVISYGVTQRTHEIGIRMALGAQRGDVLGAFLRQGLTLAAAGIAAGLAGAYLLTRFLASLLYQIRPADPLTFAAAALILGAVALLATWLPARRAAHLDPLRALRHQ